MPGDKRLDERQLLTELREHARLLAEQLPAPLSRIRVRSGEVMVEIEWQPPPGSAPTGPAMYARDELLPPPSKNGHPLPDGTAGTAVLLDGTAGAPALVISSPMVGTFYRAAEPGAEPFISVGEVITVGQVIGIVEAMKLMNPILADVSGVVVSVHADDAEAVEFGQILLTLSEAAATTTAPGG